MSAALSILRARCAECDGLRAVTPSAWRVVEGEVRCSYRCPACRHVWVTGWRLETLGVGYREAAA